MKSLVQRADRPVGEIILANHVIARARRGLCADADHSFHVPARSGTTNKQLIEEALDAIAEWFERMVSNKR
jgi:hypothetical protein